MKLSRDRNLQVISRRREVPADAQREIKIFLQALASYPERFACDPRLSFERHLVALAAESAAEYSPAR